MISSEVWNCCLGIIKLSIGIDTSAAIFGIMRFNETKELRFKIVGVSQTKKQTADGVPAIEQVPPKRRAFNQKRYNISVLCRFYFYIIFSIA